uniref:Uncharacterized protein n=1 Tax=Ananas comosus var. bracteatus TaxID=296719 RepID=A0A6V7NIU7_ANACO|nr:unnamed protein product [Ananas comosus var. bracteatus]
MPLAERYDDVLASLVQNDAQSAIFCRQLSTGSTNRKFDFAPAFRHIAIREKKKKEEKEKKKRNLLEGAWRSTRFSPFHPCLAWSLLVELGGGPIFNPRRFGAWLEASWEGLDWKGSSSLLELRRRFLLLR